MTTRRTDPGRQGRLSVRHRRLRSLRPHRSHQQPVHAAGPLRRPQLRQRVHRRLHEQADRHAGAGRRPAARRVRHGAAARFRRARARDRPGGDPPPEPASARTLSLQPRDHVSGLRAAGVRQRELPAGARPGRRDDRLRSVHPGRAAEAARARAATSAWASSATSRAPASVRTKAPG